MSMVLNYETNWSLAFCQEWKITKKFVQGGLNEQITQKINKPEKQMQVFFMHIVHDHWQCFLKN